MGQSLVLFPTLGNDVEWHYIYNFSVKKCQNFEGMGRTLWSDQVPYNTLKGLSSVPCEQGYFLAIKDTGFWSHGGHKTAAAFEKSDESKDGVFLPLLLS